jgi:hypothetical protein
VIEGLVGNPAESLTVELKRWIDPTQAAGVSSRAGGAILVGVLVEHDFKA